MNDQQYKENSTQDTGQLNKLHDLITAGAQAD
jgi:hypothetical protein